MEMQGKEIDDDVIYKEVRKKDTASCLPTLFEGSKFGVLNPGFASPILEQYFEECFFPRTRRKARSALIYVGLSCAIWAIYFGATWRSNDNWLGHIIGTCSLLVVSALFFLLTFFDIYARHYNKVSVAYALIICVVSLLRYIHLKDNSRMAMSSIGAFCCFIEIVLLIYNLLPLRFYLAIGLSLSYSIAYEGLFIHTTQYASSNLIVGRVLLHICVHLVGTSLHLMATVRKHSTFSRIGQSAVTRRDLKVETAQQDNLIYSLMPAKVATEAIKSRNIDKRAVSRLRTDPLHR